MNIHQITELPFTHQCAFLASCCERQVPTYDAYFRLLGAQQTDLLRRGTDLVWSCALGNQVGAPDVNEFVSHLKMEIPTPWSPINLFREPATFGADVVEYSAKYCLQPSGDLLDAVQILIRQSILAYLSMAAAPCARRDYFHWTEITEWMSDSLIQRAEDFIQADQFQFLQDHASITKDVVREMKDLFSLGGVAPNNRGVFPVLSDGYGHLPRTG